MRLDDEALRAAVLEAADDNSASSSTISNGAFRLARMRRDVKRWVETSGRRLTERCRSDISSDALRICAAIKA